MMRRTLRTLVVVAATCVSSAPAFAQSITLGWDPSVGADGYLLWRGTTSGSYTENVDVGNVTEFVVTDLVPDQTYYYAVQAYAGSAFSALSSAITVRIALAPPSFAPFRLMLRNSAGTVNYWSFAGANLYETGALDPMTVDSTWQVATTADFTGDLEPDILWHNVSGEHTVWEMNGNARIANIPLTPSYVHPSWRPIAATDMNGDAQQDLVWQSTGGNIGVWLMAGTVQMSNLPFSPSYVAPSWLLEAVADMTGDGFDDLVWRNNVSGALGLWEMVGATRLRTVALEPSSVAPSWKILGARDLNGDGHPDLIWHSLTSNSVAIWTMNGPRKIESLLLSPSSIPTGWSVIGIY